MERKLIVVSEVEADIASAFAWYEEQRAGQGEHFLRTLDDRIKSILRSPELFEPVDDRYRRATVGKFPYS